MVSESEKSNILNLNDAILQKAIQEHSLMLVDFWAPWCRPCVVLAPIIDKVSQKYEGKVVVGKVDIDENGMMSKQLNFKTIPTLIIFKKGKVVENFSGGGLSLEDISKKLDEYL